MPRCLSKLSCVLFIATASLLACSVRSRIDNGISAVGLTPGEWAQLSKPGPSHKLLSGFVGNWSVEVEFWSSADTKGEVSQGNSRIVEILGGRFLEEHFVGRLGSEGYAGLGIIGYDNGSRLFKSVWIDSLNTALTTSDGRFMADSNSFEFESKVYDPLASGEKVVRSSLVINSHDSYRFSMFTRDTQGREFKSLEMRYSRE
jgi:hypothetical protein